MTAKHIQLLQRTVHVYSISDKIQPATKENYHSPLLNRRKYFNKCKNIPLKITQVMEPVVYRHRSVGLIRKDFPFKNNKEL